MRQKAANPLIFSQLILAKAARGPAV